MDALHMHRVHVLRKVRTQNSGNNECAQRAVVMSSKPPTHRSFQTDPPPQPETSPFIGYLLSSCVQLPPPRRAGPY